jgi:hypothetical protein
VGEGSVGEGSVGEGSVGKVLMGPHGMRAAYLFCRALHSLCVVGAWQARTRACLFVCSHCQAAGDRECFGAGDE